MGGVASIWRPIASRVLWLPALLGAAFARAGFSGAPRPLRLRHAGRRLRASRRLSVDGPAHRARRRARCSIISASSSCKASSKRSIFRRVGARLILRGRGCRRHAGRRRAAPGARHHAQGARCRGGRLCRADGAPAAALARRRCRAATISRATLISPASARSARRSARSTLAPAPARRAAGACASAPRSTAPATRSPRASTRSSAATRARSPPRW